WFLGICFKLFLQGCQLCERRVRIRSLVAAFLRVCPSLGELRESSCFAFALFRPLGTFAPLGPLLARRTRGCAGKVGPPCSSSLGRRARRCLPGPSRIATFCASTLASAVGPPRAAGMTMARALALR